MMTFRGSPVAAYLAPLALTLSFACGPKEDTSATNPTADGSDSDSDASASGTTSGSNPTNDPSDPSMGPSGSESGTDSTTNDPTNESAPGTTGCNFICEPDGGVGGQTCDPGLQDCPDGEKCTPYVQEPGYCCVDSTHCVQVMGAGQFGDPCTREEDTDDCAKGLFCMTETSGSTGEGVCLNLCEVGNPSSCADAGQADAECIAFNNGILPLCQSPCDPLIQDCSMGMGCYAGGDSFVCAQTIDNAPGDGGECYTIQSCQPGFVCVGATILGDCNSERCCSPWCDLNDPDPDALCVGPMESCVPWYEMGTAPPGHEDVGVCGVPA